MTEFNRPIVRGQKITTLKKTVAKQLRHDQTEAEDLLWQALRHNQLDGLHFRRQQIIDGFIVDFYCRAALLVVEVDGDIHLMQQAYDSDRDGALQRRGLIVLRIKNEDVIGNLPGVLQRIMAIAKERTSLPTSLSPKGERGM